MRSGLVLATALLFAAPARAASVLTVALAGDPGALDPAQSGNYLDRDVLAAICDKLIDTSPDMVQFVPQLATSWAWSPDGRALSLQLRPNVQFQDGTRFDAAAVKTNLDRDRSMPGSLRRAELAPVSEVDVTGPLSVTIRLSAPYVPLLAVLADRSGMMLSPKAIAAQGKDIAQHPVCAGPYAFTERVPQDHITVDRFPAYWNAASIGIDRVIYRPMPDSTIRLVNLQSGQVQIADQVAPTDAAAVQADPKLVLAEHTAAAYRSIQFNLAHGSRADTKLGQDPRVRRAFEKTIDRQAINQVAFNGLFVPNNQPVPPDSPYWDKDHPVPARDLAGAKALLREAGVSHVAFTLQIANSPVDRQIGEIIQAMAAEAGLDIKLQSVETNAGNQADLDGDFDAALLTWSGRADPDANIAIWFSCNGPFNFGRYCNKEVDDLLARARAAIDPAQRIPLYHKVIGLILADMPQVILYNYRWLWGMGRQVQGFVPNADGLIRLQGMRLAGSAGKG